MDFITRKQMPRRTFLRGMGATVALPFLDAMVPAGRTVAQAATSDRTRLVCIEEVHGLAGCNNWGATKHSYELMARYVFPHFQNLNDNRHASMSWVKENKEEFTTQVRGAVGARIVQHMMEKGADNIRPEIVALITGAAAPPKAD